MNESSNWRIRVLERLEENKDFLCSQMDAGEFETLSKIANFYQDNKIVTEKLLNETNYSPDQMVQSNQNTENGFYLESQKKEVKILCKAQNSFLQKISSDLVPVHLQVVVPNAIGTNDLSPVQNFEVNTWFIAISKIAAELDTGLVFFEFCTASTPLIINIFPAPTDDSTLHIFKNSFEENMSDLNETQLIKLNTHIQKNIFRKGSLYIAVTFDEPPGIVKLYEGEENPLETVIEIVKTMWEDAKEEPPDGFIKAIKNYNDWPK